MEQLDVDVLVVLRTDGERLDTHGKGRTLASLEDLFLAWGGDTESALTISVQALLGQRTGEWGVPPRLRITGGCSHCMSWGDALATRTAGGLSGAGGTRRKQAFEVVTARLVRDGNGMEWRLWVRPGRIEEVRIGARVACSKGLTGAVDEALGGSGTGRRRKGSTPGGAGLRN